MSRNSRVRSREAQWRPGKLEAEPLRDVANFVEQYRRLWDETLDRLGTYLHELQAVAGRHALAAVSLTHPAA